MPGGPVFVTDVFSGRLNSAISFTIATFSSVCSVARDLAVIGDLP
ncbi:hypothetical protein [Candidatus Poriferisodalis sp.]